MQISCRYCGDKVKEKTNHFCQKLRAYRFSDPELGSFATDFVTTTDPLANYDDGTPMHDNTSPLNNCSIDTIW